MLCVLYVNLIAACLGVIALLVEQMLPDNWPRRWVWCATIPMSMFIPGYYSTHHNWSVIAALEQQPTQASLGHALGVGSLPVFDPTWWAHDNLFDVAIHPVWLTASVVLIAWALLSAWRVARIMTLARRQRDPRKPTIIDGVPIVVTDAIGPATVGLLRSRVLVPRWVLALPACERQYVLRHEEEHRRSRDGLLLFVASLPLIVAPWNLGLWWIVRRLCLAVEMDCDTRVVGALGDPHAYGELLLKVAESGYRGPRLQPAFLGMGMLERRLNQLVAPTRLRKLQRLVVPSLAAALLALVIWMPHPVRGHTSHAGRMTTSSPPISHSSSH